MIGEIELYFASTKYQDFIEETNEVRHFEDQLNDIPVDEDFIESHLVENADNMEMKMDLRFQGLDKAVLKISLNYADGAYISDLRYALDKDMNGIVEAGEIHEGEVLFIKNDINEKRFGMDLKVDGESGEISAIFGMEGLLGNVNDESGIQITAEVTYSFNITEDAIHHIELRSLVENIFWDPEDLWFKDHYNITEIGNMMDLKFITPVGWRIQTSSIHPSSMADHVNDQRNMVKLDPYDFSKILDPDVELFKFDVKFEGGDGWDDLDKDSDDDVKDQIEDDEEKKETPVPIWIMFLSISIVTAVILLIDRRKR